MDLNLQKSSEPASSVAPKTPAPLAPASPQQSVAPRAEAAKYSIRTMAQDLERAKKEGLSLPIKQPSTPPPPPPQKISPLKAMPSITPLVAEPQKRPLPEIIAPKKPIAVPLPQISLETAGPEKSITPLAKPTEIIPETPLAFTKRALPVVSPTEPITPPPATMPITTKPSFKPSVEIPPPPTLPIYPAAKPMPIPPIAEKTSRLKDILSSISLPSYKLIAGVALIIVLFLGTAGFSYWWFFVKELPLPTTESEEQIPEEQLPPAPELTEPTLPSRIIPVSEDIIVDTDSEIPLPETTSKIISEISTKSSFLKNGELGRVLIKFSSQAEKRFLSFNQTYLMLGLAIPESVGNEIISGELLAHNQNGKIRYGLAATTINNLKTIDVLNGWGNTMPDDLNSLFLDFTPTKPPQGIFRDNFYKNFVKSYYNFSEPDSSIDWGVSDVDNILVIATSRDMIYKIIDALSIIEQ